MIIIYGTGPYGKTDEVPGFFHVSTMFFYLYWFPLVPYRSLVMIDAERGVPIGLSLKSVVFGYLRSACIVAAIVASGIALIAGLAVLEGAKTRYRGAPARALGISLAVVGGAVALHQASRMASLNRPSYERAMMLAEQLGVNEEGLGLAGALVRAHQRAGSPARHPADRGRAGRSGGESGGRQPHCPGGEAAAARGEPRVRSGGRRQRAPAFNAPRGPR